MAQKQIQFYRLSKIIICRPIIFSLGLWLIFTGCEKKEPIPPNHIGNGNDTPSSSDLLGEAADKSHLSIATLIFKSNSVQPKAATGLRPGYTVPAAELSKYPNHGYQAANYIGAIDPSATNLWYDASKWSFYAHIVAGSNDKARTAGNTEVPITDASMRTNMSAGSHHVTWTKSNTYILDGLVFVQDGEVLTIEAGTVIKGKAKAQGEPASSLIIARGGKIMANGTAQEPIIFTFEADPLDGSTAATTRGRWGGLLILGKAGLNSTPGETSVEGIPTNEQRGLYGGGSSPDNSDNSGTLRYVSIRHGGSVIGADNEINGLTLGGVGSGTTLEYIEIVGNKDDGIECFGGTVNVRYLISAYNQDDAVDYDEGYRGFCQFVIVHQDPASKAADRGFECDGGTKPETGTPYATPMFANVTVVGNSGSRVATIRDNAGGFFYNLLAQGSGKGIDVEYTTDEQDSWKQMKDGNLDFRHHALQIGTFTKLEDVYTITVAQ